MWHNTNAQCLCSSPCPISFSFFKLEDKFPFTWLVLSWAIYQVVGLGCQEHLHFLCLLCNFFHVRHQEMPLDWMPLNAPITCFSLTSLRYILSLYSSFFKFGLCNFLACDSDLFISSQLQFFSFVKCRCSYPIRLLKGKKTGYFCM